MLLLPFYQTVANVYFSLKSISVINPANKEDAEFLILKCAPHLAINYMKSGCVIRCFVSLPALRKSNSARFEGVWGYTKYTLLGFLIKTIESGC